MQKTKQNTKEPIPCLISHCACCQACHLTGHSHTGDPKAALLTAAWSQSPQVAAMRCCCAESSWLEVKDFAGVKKKNSAERFFIRKPAEIMPFSLEEVLCTWGIDIYQRPWQNISEEAPCSYFVSMRVLGFFPNCKSCSTCHKANGSSLPPSFHGVWCWGEHLPLQHKSNLSTVHLGPSTCVSHCARTVGPPAKGPQGTLLTTSHLPALVQHSWFFFSALLFIYLLLSIVRIKKKRNMIP